MATASAYSTPVNSLNRNNITVLIRNNTLNDSVEFETETEMMETDSPVRKSTGLQPITKKLFHSPALNEAQDKEANPKDSVKCTKKRRKRKQCLIPNSAEKIKKVYLSECDTEMYSPDVCGGMRKKVLVSLFHNKEYSIEFS